MKQAVLMSLVALGLLVACSAGSGGRGQSLALGAAPWKDGDRLVYDIVDKNGSKVGTSEFGFARDGDAWVLSGTDKAAGLDQTAKVRVDAKSLKPLGEEKTIKTQNVDATINTTYQDGKLTINAVQNGQKKSVSMDVPANSIENDQLLMTLRALPFAEGYQAKFSNVVGQNAAVIDTTASVLGKEQVDVPAGSFSTWKVELDFVQTKQQAWYQVDAPYNMVQYDNGATRMVLTTQR